MAGPVDQGQKALERVLAIGTRCGGYEGGMGEV